MPIDVQPIDAVRLRILIQALKDTGRTMNPIVFPMAYYLRSKQQNIFHPLEVELARSLSVGRPKEPSVIRDKLMPYMFPFLKELTPTEFSDLITDVKARGPSYAILEEDCKAGNLEETAGRLKALRQLSPEYTALSGLKHAPRGIARALSFPLRSIRNSMRSIRYDLADTRTRSLMERGLKGGPGSGNFGHTGRIGGGSNPTIPHGGVFSGIQSAVPGSLGREKL